MKKLAIYLTSLICLISFSAFTANEDPFAELLKKLGEFTKKYPQEKIHIHLDKPYYGIGDKIWLKAYVVDAKTSAPTSISNILYVELVNDRDSVTRQIKLPMQSGITWGDFNLSDSLAEGNYRIRAYTQWMRNAGPEFFFDKTIKIGNGWTNKVFTTTNYQYTADGSDERVKTTIKFANAADVPFTNAEVNYQVILGAKKTAISKVTTNALGEISINVTNSKGNTIKSGHIIATILLPDGKKIVKNIPIKATTNAIAVQFFPEGGSLVEGLPCKVAFKAVNSNGLGENISGQIVDNEGIEVLTFESGYLGMGSFSLNAMSGKTYQAKIKFADKTEKTFSIPKSISSGYLLTVNNLDSAKMSVKVMLTPDLLNKGELTLIAQHNGNVLFTTKVPTVKQIASIVVPKTSFPSGILQLTLFDTLNQPVSERLTFVNNTIDKIYLNAQNLKPTYLKKGKVDFSINAVHNNQPLQGSFSVAVTNTSVINPDLENESNILTSLLLTSDLKGYVEKPNHYFLKNDMNTKVELDHLLLTQGWRKIDWKAVDSDPSVAIAYPAEKSMKISGMVTNNGKPVVKGKVSLFSSSKVIFAVDTLTDENGRFNFDKIAFNDSIRFALKAITNTDHKGVKITMDDLPGQIVTTNKNTGDIVVDINESIKEYLKQSAAYFNDQEAKGFLSRVNELQAVEIVGKINKASSTSSNLNGPGNADAVFSADDLKNSVSLSHFLQGRVAGLRIDGNLPISGRNGGTMTVYADGVMIIDGQGGEAGPQGGLDDITLLDIESVEVLKSINNTTIYGHAGTNGVIVITTKPGKEKTNFNTRAPGMLAYNSKGFYAVKQFYVPQYDVNPANKPDLRTTVYWDPNLVSDASGNAKINYFNTDQAGEYRVVIEGIDAYGNIARKTFNYQVN